MNIITLSSRQLLEKQAALESRIRSGRADANDYVQYLACQLELKRRCAQPINLLEPELPPRPAVLG